MFKSLIDMLNTNKSDDVGITYILNENSEKFVSYNNLFEKATCSLHVLQSKGIKPGDKVILQIEDLEKYIYSLWACILGGIIPVPLSVGITDEQIARLYRVYNLLEQPYVLTTDGVFKTVKRFEENADSEINWKFDYGQVILYDEIDQGIEKGIIYDADLDDIALIMFSSGSTGEPKGVKTTHRNILVTNEDLIEKFNVDLSDVSLHWMPLTHMVGIVFCHLFPIMTSTPQYLMDKMVYIRSPKIWLNKICEHRATILLTANFGMKYLMSKVDKNENNGWDLSHIKVITVGGEPMSSSLFDSFLSFLKDYGIEKRMISPVYGVTEAMVAACVSQEKVINSYCLDRGNLSIGSEIKDNLQEGIIFVGLGAPPKRCKVRICDNEDNILAEGKVGHIQVSGPNVTPGYYLPVNDAFSADGWYKTGDVGFILNEEIVITGRAKEMIIVNMVNYYLFDIESVIEKVDNSLIGNIAACGILNKDTLEDDVILFIQNEGNEQERFGELVSEIKYSVKSKMGLDIKYVIPIKELPRTGVGKIGRIVLKNRYLNGEFNEIIAKTNLILSCKKNEFNKQYNGIDVSEKLIGIIKSILEIENVMLSDNIFELDVQSLTAMQIAVEIEDYFGILFDLRGLYENPSVEEISNRIKELLVEKSTANGI